MFYAAVGHFRALLRVIVDGADLFLRVVDHVRRDALVIWLTVMHRRASLVAFERHVCSTCAARLLLRLHLPGEKLFIVVPRECNLMSLCVVLQDSWS